jgi:hypothetical protein
MIAEIDMVALTRDAEEHGLVAGDVGAVVHVYAAADAFENNSRVANISM